MERLRVQMEGSGGPLLAELHAELSAFPAPHIPKEQGSYPLLAVPLELAKYCGSSRPPLFSVPQPALPSRNWRWNVSVLPTRKRGRH